MMTRNTLGEKIFYGVVFFIYALVIVWLCKHIWGEPETSFARNLRIYEETISEKNEGNIKYDIAGIYRTVNNYRIYHFNGWQVEKKDGIWENTLQKIILEGGEKTYSVDIIREDLKYAPRIIGSDLKDKKFAFRAIFPTKEMETGIYRVGMLLEDDEVVWTDHRFYVGIYSEQTEKGSILINDANLLYYEETNTLEGMGADVCIKVENNSSSQKLHISYDAKSIFEDTYLIFYANDITIKIDLSQEVESYECILPLQNGSNEIWIYCVVGGNTSLETGKKYYCLNNIKFEILD